MVALELFNQMLGSVPDFQQGAVIAVVMLIPSIAIVGLMALLERYAIRYNKTAPIELPRGRVRDGVCMGASALVLGGILALFAVIFIVPFVEMWPFRPSFTLDHVAAIFTDAELFGTLTNSIAVAVATAVLGCILAYAAALVVARSNLPRAAKRAVDAIALGAVGAHVGAHARHGPIGRLGGGGPAGPTQSHAGASHGGGAAHRERGRGGRYRGLAGGARARRGRRRGSAERPGGHRVERRCGGSRGV